MVTDVDLRASIVTTVTVTDRVPPPEPMAMLLTRCERAWVDDLRAGRAHVHRGSRA